MNNITIHNLLKSSEWEWAALTYGRRSWNEECEPLASIGMMNWVPKQLILFAIAHKPFSRISHSSLREQRRSSLSLTPILCLLILSGTSFVLISMSECSEHLNSNTLYKYTKFTKTLEFRFLFSFVATLWRYLHKFLYIQIEYFCPIKFKLHFVLCPFCAGCG